MWAGYTHLNHHPALTHMGFCKHPKLSLIGWYPTPSKGLDYQGQFGTFHFPLKCGVGNGKSSSKSLKHPNIAQTRSAAARALKHSSLI